MVSYWVGVILYTATMGELFVGDLRISQESLWDMQTIHMAHMDYCNRARVNSEGIVRSYDMSEIFSKD